jgi:hypothetical protein
MHAILLQAHGVRWAVITVSGGGLSRRHRALVRRKGLKARGVKESLGPC